MDPIDLTQVPAGAMLLVDTAPIIYVLESHPQFGQRFESIFKAHADGMVNLAVTTVTIAEVLTGPYKAGRDDLAMNYRFVLEEWHVVDLDIGLAELAARVRADVGLKLPDAVQIAAAISVGAFALVTHDRDFSRYDKIRIIS